ncbi:hypothetical protein NLI96_g11788 [Meripilus lineatus]|uniref:Uncharacterized protein n=1 Tax=Meripilus lineatus TaxID=2056292 RepID=A0AAD5UR69_9APHY|nr:hypothetical protein NLI96_g11788 [Physisporinus lineatus]
MNIVFHSYEDLTGLPPDVSRLIETSQAPLPPWLDTEKLTSWCKERRVHELNDFCDAHMNDEVFGSLMEPLRDVLSFAMRIDAVSRIDDEFSPRRTQYLWFSLIQRLGLWSHRPETTSVLYDQAFAQPNGFNSESGTASMLVSFKADRALLEVALNPREFSDPFEHPLVYGEGELDVEPEDEETEVDESECEEDVTDISEGVDTVSRNGTTTDDSTTDDSITEDSTTDNPITDDPIIDDSFSDVDHNRPSTPPFVDYLDLPLCAQILAGSNVWPVALFPIFSVADTANIIPLVASIVYQRAVWDIQLPVVAFEISKVGRVGYVHIGWAEEIVHQDVPIIHILRPSKEPSTCPSHIGSPGTGVFDLGCSESATQFSKLVLSLNHQLDILEHELPMRHPNLIRWRNDEVTSMWKSPWLDSNDRVTEWSKGVPNGAATLLVSPDDASDSQTSIDDSKLNQSGRLSDFAPAESVPQVINPIEPSIEPILFGRRAFCIAKEEVDGYGAPAELKYMINVYDEMTKFSSPEEGSVSAGKLGDPGEMGVKNTPLKDILSEFMAAYDKLIDQGFKPSILEDVYGRILVAKFREMGGVFCAARSMLASHIVGFLESETRAPWDQILSLCYVTAGDVLEAHSDHVLFEAELRLASNPLANLAVDSDEIEEWSELALVYVNMCAAAPKKARGRGAVELESLYRKCYLAATHLLARIVKASIELPDYLDIVRTQARMEPSTVICNALLVAPIRVKVDEKDIGVARQAYHGFRLIHLPKPKYESPFSIDPSILIHIPQLVVCYKKPSDGEKTTSNRVKMSLTTSVLFLAHLGIFDHAVFGLVVEGMIGFLIMAWKSKSKDAIFIIEHNVKQFNLTNILQVYELMIFLQRLRTRGEEMMSKIQGDESKLKDPEVFIRSLHENGLPTRNHAEWAIPSL